MHLPNFMTLLLNVFIVAYWLVILLLIVKLIKIMKEDGDI